MAREDRETTRDGRTDAAVLHDFATHVQASLSSAGLVSCLAETVAQALPLTGAAVLTVQPSGTPRLAHATNRAIDGLERVHEALGQGPSAEALTTRQAVVRTNLGDDFARWPDYTQHALAVGIHAVAALPMVTRARAWGTLNLYREPSEPFEEADLALASALAAVAAGFVVLIQDREQARHGQRQDVLAATLDPLTGLANRTLLNDRFRHALAVALRREAPLGVIFVDLDDFKAVNDTYGHEVGDRVLVECASRLTQAVRLGDTLARVGGDEFVLVCENLPADSVHPVAASLRAIIARIETALAAPVSVGGHRIALTASIGAASSVDGVADLDVLLRDADQAMYRSKQSRDRQQRPSQVDGLAASSNHGIRPNHASEPATVSSKTSSV